MNISVLHCDGYEPNSCFFSGKPNKYRFGEQSLGPKRREAKATQIESIQRKLSNDRAEVILLGDSIIKNIERFAPKYFTLFPASTVLNAGIPGDTVEAILYRVLHMSFPLTVTCISLLCGTNNLSSHSPATISATVMEILFVLRQKCPTCVIHLFPNLPRFDQFFSNVRATNTYIYFHVKNFFPDVLLHDLPSSLYNRNVYREDKLHLTKKGNDILTKWFHYCISNASPPANPTLNTSPSDFASNDEDWPALPQPSPKPNPTPPIPCPLSSRNLIQSTKSKFTQPAYPNKTFSPTHPSH